ncbi:MULTISPECIES: hypothetical protein [unclassified Nonomuraea]|uniref:hypothetical protein n=1 Tax=unclassified Nonomuraea TaxID=2593643 RepID=UPI0033DDC5C3
MEWQEWIISVCRPDGEEIKAMPRIGNGWPEWAFPIEVGNSETSAMLSANKRDNGGGCTCPERVHSGAHSRLSRRTFGTRAPLLPPVRGIS